MKNVSIKGWLLAGLATTLLIGCDIQVQSDWERAPKEYTCSLEDQARVERETLFCKTNTSYRSAYCYSAAIMRNCDKIEPEKSNDNAAESGTESGGEERRGTGGGDHGGENSREECAGITAFSGELMTDTDGRSTDFEKPTHIQPEKKQ